VLKREPSPNIAIINFIAHMSLEVYNKVLIFGCGYNSSKRGKEASLLTNIYGKNLLIKLEILDV